MKVTILQTGLFKLDGGAMFGVVPKRMWSKLNPPDENNMCTWAMRVLLVETGDRKILVDTGMGNKQDAKFRSFFEPHGEDSLLGSLAAVGVKPENITDVFFTHLHFDHCGGALLRDASGEVYVPFPNATYWTNQRHFDWAMKPNAREKASFLPENFLPLYEMGKMQFVEVKQDLLFAPGFQVRFFNGHTEAMMSPVLKTEDHTIVYCADLIPSQWHVGMPYVLAFDVRPLVTLKEKERLLKEAVKKKHILVFEHDPFVDCGTVKEDANGRIWLDKVGRLSDFIV